jgi:hypothetical protein
MHRARDFDISGVKYSSTATVALFNFVGNDDDDDDNNEDDDDDNNEDDNNMNFFGRRV